MSNLIKSFLRLKKKAMTYLSVPGEGGGDKVYFLSVKVEVSGLFDANH